MRYYLKAGLAIGVSLISITAIWIAVIPSSPLDAHSYAKENEQYDGSKFMISQYNAEADAVGCCPIDYYFLTLNVTDEDFDAETNNKYLRYGCLMNDVGPIPLVESDNPYVIQIAKFIEEICISDNDYAIIHCVQKLIGDNICYKSDDELYGTFEYWATPTETIRMCAGDCEDRSILACSVLLALGYDCAMVSSPQHIAPAVYLDESLYIMDFDTPYHLVKIENYPDPIEIYTIKNTDISVSKLIGTYIYTLRDIMM